MSAATRLRRARFNVAHWLLAHTQTGRAVLWHEWLKGREFEKRRAMSDSAAKGHS